MKKDNFSEKKFDKFIKLNKKTINYHNNNKYLMIIDRGKFLSALNNMMLVIALNKKFKLNPIVITDFRKKNFINFYKSFGIKKFKIGFKYFLVFKKVDILLKSLKKFLITIFLLRVKNFDWFINKFNINKIKIGDLVYDSYIRVNHNYINPKIDLFFLNLLFKAIFRAYNLLDYIDKYPTKFMLIGTSAYSHNDGIALRVALKKKIKVVEAQPHQLIIFKSNMYNFGIDNLKENFYKYKKNYNLKISEINSFYKKKKNGQITSFFTGSSIYFIANKFKNRLNKIQLLKKINLSEKNFKKIVLVAPHCFSDSPHGDGKIIFTDFYSHFKETLEFISKSKELNSILWLIKPHPASASYDEVGIAEKLTQQFATRNIQLCPNKINTKDLLNICDHVITVRGSIGLESACEGKKSIIAGYAAYSDLGFTSDSKNKNEYFNHIKNINNIKPLTKKQTNEARKAMYILENKINQFSIKRSNITVQDSWSKSFKSKKEKGLYEKDSPEINLFSNRFLKNFESIKFENDSYYKDILKKLKHVK